jgi:glycosyltransferase involved in cell wall biosynthesis
LAADLKKLGWQVDILAPHAPRSKTQEVLDGVMIKRFRYLWPEGLETVCYEGGALVKLQSQKSNFLKLLPFLLSECLSLIWQLKTRNYDLLHTHWILPQGFIGALVTKILNIPHITTVHGGDVFGLNSKFYLRLKKFAAANADAITVNSSVTEKAVRGFTSYLEHVYSIPMGVTESVRPGKKETDFVRQKFGVEGPLLIFVGRIVEEKGVGDLIDAMTLLIKQFPRIKCIIIGEGPDRKNFELKASQLGLSANIHFTGWIKNDVLPSYLSSADVFVGPSKQAQNGWLEGQGLTFIEAMMVETPVVATRCGGIVDLVRQEETGLLVEQNSPAQIASAVLRLLGDSSLASSLSRKAKLFVEGKFSRSVSAQAFSNLYNKILSNRENSSKRRTK